MKLCFPSSGWFNKATSSPVSGFQTLVGMTVKQYLSHMIPGEILHPLWCKQKCSFNTFITIRSQVRGPQSMMLRLPSEPHPLDVCYGQYSNTTKPATLLWRWPRVQTQNKKHKSLFLNVTYGIAAVNILFIQWTDIGKKKQWYRCSVPVDFKW